MPPEVIEGQDPTPTPGVEPAANPDPGNNPGGDSGGDPSSPNPASNPLNTDPVEGQDPPADSGQDSGDTVTPWYQGDQLPADWREQLAGEDTKTLNILKRVDGIPTLVKNYLEAQETIRKGSTGNEGPPEDDAALAKWREDRGVPAAADAYELDLSEGLVLSDDDKADLQPMLEQFHGMNLTNEQASSVVNEYFKMESLQQDRLAAQDRVDQTEAQRTMEKNWGGDYETNLNLIKSMITQEFPSDIVDDLIGARLGNGKALFNEPGVMAAFAKIARLVNPTAALVPSGHNPMQTLNDKIADFEKQMQEPGWHKNESAQKEYMDLLTARDQLSSRHGG